MTNERVIQEYLDQIKNHLDDLPKKERLRFLTEYEETLLDQYADYCKLHPLNLVDDFIKTLESPKDVATQLKAEINYKKTFGRYLIGVTKRYRHLSMQHPVLSGSISGATGAFLVLLIIYLTIGSVDNYWAFGFNYSYGIEFPLVSIILVLLTIIIVTFSSYDHLLNHMSYGISTISTYILLLWLFDYIEKIQYHMNTGFLSSTSSRMEYYYTNFVPSINSFLDPYTIFHGLLSFLFLIAIICFAVLILRIVINHEKNFTRLLSISSIITILLFTFLVFSVPTMLNPFFYVPADNGTYYEVDMTRVDGQVPDNSFYARPVPVLGNLYSTYGGIIQINHTGSIIMFGYAKAWYSNPNSNSNFSGTLPVPSFPWSWTYANKSAWEEYVITMNGTIINGVVVQSKLSNNYYIETRTNGSSVMEFSVDITADDLVSYNATGSFTNSSTFTSITITKVLLYYSPIQKNFTPYIIVGFIIWTGIFSISLLFAYLLPTNALMHFQKLKNSRITK